MFTLHRGSCTGHVLYSVHILGSPYTEGAVQDMYNGDYDGVSSESEEEIPVVRTPK